MGSKKGIPSLAAAQLQRWEILLSAYDYNICYKCTSNHGNADSLSRLPIPSTLPDLDSQCVTTFNLAQMQAFPVTVGDIQKATAHDIVLGKVYRYIQEKWPSKISEELQPYKHRENDLSTENGCVMWGMRAVVTQTLHSQVLKSLHSNHPGITRMKAIARSYFWITGLDKAIEELGKSCPSCQVNQANTATGPLHPWIWPDTPWKRIHVDFAGPYLGHMFFVAVDAHSKWPEVEVISTTTFEKTIEVLRSLFARHVYPEQLVSDSGPQFISAVFKKFIEGSRIKDILSAPYHSASMVLQNV